MALIEGDEQLARAKALIQKISSDPRTRLQFQHLAKTVDPSLVIPELDIARTYAAPLYAKLEEQGKEIAGLRDEIAKKDVMARANEDIAEGRSRLRGRGFADGDIARVEELMQKKGIIDYEAAADHYEKMGARERALSGEGLGASYGLSNLMNPPEDNPWVEAVKPRPAAQRERAIKIVQDKEVRSWLAENRGGDSNRRRWER